MTLLRTPTLTTSRRARSAPLFAAAALALGACAEDAQPPASTVAGLEFEDVDIEDPPSEVTLMLFLPDDRGLILGTRGGEVVHYTLDEDGAKRRGAFTVPHVYVDLDCGLISAAAAPDFTTSGHLYVAQCTSKTESAIRRLELTIPPAPGEGKAATGALALVADSDVDILRVGDPRAQRPWHNVGQIGFEPDGTLWALFGDKTLPDNGQDMDDELGALVRLVPGADGGATPADDNPWPDVEGVSAYVYATGLRSPWRGARDAAGRWYIGDVGQDTIEEVNVLTEPGQNFGWAEHEGPCVAEDCSGVSDPMVFWGRTDDDPLVVADPEAEASPSRVVWVGPAYEPTTDRYGGLLAGRVLYGDLCVGFVRGLRVDASGALADDMHLGHLPGATAMTTGPDGYLYAATFGRCTTGGPGSPTRLVRALPTLEDDL